MSRPGDWSALGRDRDPIPGEPGVVRAAAAHYDSVADEIERQTARLRQIGSHDDLQGDYKVTLVQASETTADQLAKVAGRYRTTSSALGGWPDRLEGFQSRSVTILEDARTAHDAVAGADPSVVGPLARPPADATPEQQRDFTDTRSRYDDAQGDLSGARRRLADLEDERDDAAKGLAERIKDGADDDVKDGMWDNFLDFMDKYAGVIDVIAKVLGAVGMVLLVVSLFIPGVNLITAGVLVGVAAMTAHSALALSGHGSWADVGLDLLAIGTLGASRWATAALKAGQGAVRAAGAVREGKAAADAVRLSSSAQRAALGTRMSRGSQLARSVARAEHRAVSQTMRTQMATARAQMSQLYADARVATAPLSQRVAAGLDPEVAALRGDIARVAADFPGAASIVRAVGASRLPEALAVAGAWTGTALTVANVGLDNLEVPPWQRIQDRWTFQPGSPW